MLATTVREGAQRRHHAQLGLTQPLVPRFALHVRQVFIVMELMAQVTMGPSHLLCVQLVVTATQVLVNADRAQRATFALNNRSIQ